MTKTVTWGLMKILFICASPEEQWVVIRVNVFYSSPDFQVWDLSIPDPKASSLEMILFSSAPIRQRVWIGLAAFGLGLDHLCVQYCCFWATTLSDSVRGSVFSALLMLSSDVLLPSLIISRIQSIHSELLTHFSHLVLDIKTTFMLQYFTVWTWMLPHLLLSTYKAQRVSQLISQVRKSASNLKNQQSIFDIFKTKMWIVLCFQLPCCVSPLLNVIFMK